MTPNYPQISATFYIAFYIFIVGDRRLRLTVVTASPNPEGNHPRKEGWSDYVNRFIFWGHQSYFWSLERLKPRVVNVCTQVGYVKC